MLEVERCEPCKGLGWIKGLFHKLECAACNGGGVVDAKTHAGLEYPQLVAYLREQLRRAQALPVGGYGPGDGYVGRRNARGVGGGNWTGD